MRSAAPRDEEVTWIGAQHADLCAAVHEDAFAHPWDTAAFADLLALPTVFGGLASRDGEPAGMVLVQVAADEAEILTIAVRPGWRRHRVATALLAWVAGRLQERRVARLFLEVAVDNAAARRLYERAGFRTVATRRNYYAPAGGLGADAVVMAVDVAALDVRLRSFR